MSPSEDLKFNPQSTERRQRAAPGSEPLIPSTELTKVMSGVYTVALCARFRVPSSISFIDISI